MKKITLLLLTILPIFGFAQTWDFTNAIDNWDDATTGATLVANPNYVAVNLKEGVANPKFGNAVAGVDGVTNKICAITLQNLSATGPTFLRVSFLKAAGGRTYIQQDITAGDTSYVTYYLDLTNADWGNDIPENDIQVHFKAAGNVNYTTPAGGVTINVDKIEFIPSIPTTLKETYNFSIDDDTEGFEAVNSSISGPTSGILTFTPTADKYSKLDQLLHHVDADAHKQVHITLKNNSSLNDQLRFVYAGNVTRTLSISTSDLTEKTYTFDLSNAELNPDWTGNQAFTIGIGSTVASTPGQSADAGTVEFSSIVVDNTLSTKGFNRVAFALYPNPTKGLVYLSSANKISKVTVFDMTGKQVLTTSSLSNNTINVNTLNSGLYLLQVEDVNQIKGVQKLIIK